MFRYFILGLVSLFFFGCTLAEVNVNVVSERTALENQILGSYNSLDQDMLLMASVRGVDPMGKIKASPRKSREQGEAMEGMQVMAFHEDDVDAFKRLGWVGENNYGLLTAFTLEKETVPVELSEFSERYSKEEFRSVVDAVNSARELIMRRVIEINETFAPDDLPEIRRVFGKLNRENALPGEKVQGDDGEWVEKQ